MLRDRKRSSKIVELVDCLTDDADNMLRLVREVIYYIDYPKERRPAALTLKMCSTRNKLP